MAASSHGDIVSLFGSSPSFINKLAPADQQKLHAVLRAARHTQNAEYSAATDKALQHVPALLRGTVRKIIAG